MKSNLTSKEERYAKAYVKNSGDKVQAYKDAGYSLKLNSAQMSTQADKLYNKPKINLRIKRELQKMSDKAFIKTKEQEARNAAREVAKACMNLDDEKGMVNAQAAIAALKEA